jgi:hypothetical protein
MTRPSDKANRLGSFIAAGLLIALSFAEAARAAEPMAALDAWSAAKLMGVGVNIGNTLENTTTWETGWGNPRITKKYVESLAAIPMRAMSASRTTNSRGWARWCNGSPMPACSAS